MNLDGVLVVGISQSGESKDVLETVRRSGELGASTLTVTNDEGSAMAEPANHVVSLSFLDTQTLLAAPIWWGREETVVVS